MPSQDILSISPERNTYITGPSYLQSSQPHSYITEHQANWYHCTSKKLNKQWPKAKLHYHKHLWTRYNIRQKPHHWVLQLPTPYLLFTCTFHQCNLVTAHIHAYIYTHIHTYTHAYIHTWTYRQTFRKDKGLHRSINMIKWRTGRAFSRLAWRPRERHARDFSGLLEGSLPFLELNKGVYSFQISRVEQGPSQNLCKVSLAFLGPSQRFMPLMKFTASHKVQRRRGVLAGTS